MGVVYEATQLSLNRAVALRLVPREHFASLDELDRFDERVRRAAGVHHPNLAAIFEASEWEGGRLVASRLIRGATLEELIEAGKTPPASALQPMGEALSALHAAGIAHGAVTARNILIASDGVSFLADLGLRGNATPAGDRRDLDRLASLLRERTDRRRGRAALAGAGALGLIVAAAVIAGVAGDDGATGVVEPPPPTEGTVALGSDLAATRLQPVGCSEPISPNQPACTLVPEAVAGNGDEIPADGVIRAWGVRGASGTLRLQIIRARRGGYSLVGFSQAHRATSDDPVVFRADLEVEAGDRLGLALMPGSAVGSASAGSAGRVLRFSGVMSPDPRPPSATFAGALALRVDLEEDATREAVAALVGAAARRAPAGRRIEEAVARFTTGQRALVEIVETAGDIAVDVLKGERRVARIPVPDAEPAGELIEVESACASTGGRGFCVRWQNPDAELPLEHAYLVSRDGRVRMLG